jgi:hypothetical protein
MNAALLKAINELLDAAYFALGPLDDHAAYVRHPFDRQAEPNDAMEAYQLLKQAVADVEALMPQEVFQ